MSYLMLFDFKVNYMMNLVAETYDYGIKMHNIPNAWKITKGEGIKVAVLDTGVPVHRDLDNQIVATANFTADPIEDLVQGHSSHVSGIILAEENGEGVIGIAPKAKLYSCKVLNDKGSGQDKWIASGIRWAIEQKVDIINMSLGAPASSESSFPELRNAVRAAYEAGIFIVCAAGNESANKVGIPARWPECVAVAAVDINKQHASFSNEGDALDFSAAGVNILSTFKNNTFANLSGTCLRGDTRVFTTNGPIKICEMKKGEMVFSLDDNENIVKNKCTNVLSNGVKKIYEVKTKNQTIYATDNHPFLVMEIVSELYYKIKERAPSLCLVGDKNFYPDVDFEKYIFPKNYSKEKKNLILATDISGVKLNKFINEGYGLRLSEVKKICNYLGVDDFDYYFEPSLRGVSRHSYDFREKKLVWKELKDLSTGDMLIECKNLTNNQEKSFNLKDKIDYIKTLFVRKTKKITIPEKTNDNFCQIIGAFMGDGYIIKDKRRPIEGQGICICIMQGKSGGTLSTKYKELMESVFESEVVDDNGCVRIYSGLLASIFDSLGLNKTSENKRLPSWMWSLPRSEKLAILSGIVDSDGCMQNNGNISLELCNLPLVEDIKYLFQSLGFNVSNISSRTRVNPWLSYKGREKYNQKKKSTSHSISISNYIKIRDNISTLDDGNMRILSYLCKKLEFNNKYRDFNKKKWNGDISISKVKSIKEFGSSEVFDITVDNGHNFIANGLVVHNSMAAPQIAGIAALILSEHRNREAQGETPINSPEDLKNHIKKMSIDLGEAGDDIVFGEGLPVFNKTEPEPTPVPMPVPTPAPTPNLEPKKCEDIWPVWFCNLLRIIFRR